MALHSVRHWLKRQLGSARFCNRHIALVLSLGLAWQLFLLSPVLADPLHSVTVDGAINVDGEDWVASDLVVDDAADDDTGSANFRYLYLTWDADNLYIGLTYQAIGNALYVMVDLDKGVGPTETFGTDLNFALADGHRMELTLWRPADAGLDVGIHPRATLILDDQGTVVDLDAEIQHAQSMISWPPLKRFPFGLAAEFALPWAVLYPDLETTVPPSAVLRAIAVIPNNAPNSGAKDTAPDNPGIAAGPDYVVLENLHVSIVDHDGNGEPDPINGSVSGTVTLTADPGDLAITTRAYLTSWPAGEFNVPISSSTAAAGVREVTVSRLPPGQYDIIARATGYFPATISDVSVAAGQQVTGLDFQLDVATAVSGTVSFPGGIGVGGTLSILDSEGNSVDRYLFGFQGGPFTLFVAESGEYTLFADVPEASDFLDTELPVTVTAGEDIVDLDFVVQRKTLIGGNVVFQSGPGVNGELRFLNAAGDTLDSVVFTPTAIDFAFFISESGAYTLSATAPTYIPTDTTVSMIFGSDISDFELILPRAAEVTATLDFEGPGAAGTAVIYEAGGDAVVDSLDFSAAGERFSFFLLAGSYDLVIDADGYDLRDTTISVTGSTVYDLGAMFLTAVRATHLALVDENGDKLASIASTVSIPPKQLYFYAGMRLAALDDSDRHDLFDLENRLRGYRLRARKVDDVSTPRGKVSFLDADTTRNVTEFDFVDGKALVLISNTAVEVLRVYVESDTEGAPEGRVKVGFREPRPEVVVLSTETNFLTANGQDEVIVSAQLFDSARNKSLNPEVPVTFSLSPDGTGAGLFQVATVLTNANGYTEGVLTATGAGKLLIDCSVVIDNRVLAVRADSLDSSDNLLAITAVAGPTRAWDLSLPSSLAGLEDPVVVSAQLVDRLGNATSRAGESITFVANPSRLGSFSPETALSGDTGRAQTLFLPRGEAGTVTITAVPGSTPFDFDTVDLQLQNVLVLTDPPYDEEPPTRQTFAGVDLTAVVVDNDLDDLLL
ncbi:MAG: hypothetical protein ABIF77_02690, partial [bacterium]